jgi:hypothetical protein
LWWWGHVIGGTERFLHIQSETRVISTRVDECQRARCQAVLEKRKKAMAESMEPLERRIFAENGELTSRQRARSLTN